MQTAFAIRIWLACAGLLLTVGAEADPLIGQGKLESALREAYAASCPGQTIAIDPALNRAAQRYVDAVQAGRAQPDGAELSFFASLESIDPSPAGGVATINNPAQADRAVGDLLPKSCRSTHAGVAAQRRDPDHGVVAVLTASRVLELLPIAAQAAPGASAHIEGRLLDPQLTAPRLYHRSPDGAVVESALPLVKGRFSLDVALSQAGEHSLEILADGAGGPEVIALRRVFVGVEPPAAPPPPLPAASGDGLSVVEHEIAQLRQSRGLPPLTRDPALDAVAAGHSREMARTRTFAHVLKSDGSLSDRLFKAGYAHRFAGENIGLAEDAPAAHKAIEESPAHLMNLLDPRHSRLGLGAVSGVSPDGEQGTYLTEVLAQPTIGSKDPVGDVAEVIADERKRRKLPPLVRDPRLDALANQRIRKLAAAGGRSIDPDIAQQALDQIPSLATAAAERLIVRSPDDATISKDAATREWATLGVGAIYATSKEYGPDALWILLIYAR